MIKKILEESFYTIDASNRYIEWCIESGYFCRRTHNGEKYVIEALQIVLA